MYWIRQLSATFRSLCFAANLFQNVRIKTEGINIIDIAIAVEIKIRMKPIYKRLLATLIDLLMVKVILDVLVQNGIFKTVVFETTILNKVIVFNYSNGWIILITYFFFSI
jgi:hypothetical protein